MIKNVMCRSVCACVLRGNVHLLGDGGEVFTGFTYLSLPEEEKVGEDFQLRETGSLKSEQDTHQPGSATQETAKFPSLVAQGLKPEGETVGEEG